MLMALYEQVKVSTTPAQITECLLAAKAFLRVATIALAIGIGGFGSGGVTALDLAFVAGVEGAIARQVAVLNQMTVAAGYGTKTLAGLTVGITYAYSLAVLAFLIADEVES